MAVLIGFQKKSHNRSIRIFSFYLLLLSIAITLFLFSIYKNTQPYNQTAYDNLGQNERFEYLMDKLQYRFDKDGIINFNA